jgi:hypothetical protein
MKIALTEKNNQVKSVRYIYWQDGEMWLGYLEEYPDYHTQGETLEDLQENLKDIYADISSGAIPNVKHVGELQVS